MPSGPLDSWQSSSSKSSQSHHLSTLRTGGSIGEEMDLTGATPPWLCLPSPFLPPPPPAFCHYQGFQNMLPGSRTRPQSIYIVHAPMVQNTTTVHLHRPGPGRPRGLGPEDGWVESHLPGDGGSRDRKSSSRGPVPVLGGSLADISSSSWAPWWGLMQDPVPKRVQKTPGAS